MKNFGGGLFNLRACLHFTVCFAGIQKSGHHDSFVDFVSFVVVEIRNSTVYLIIYVYMKHIWTAYSQDRATCQLLGV